MSYRNVLLSLFASLVFTSQFVFAEDSPASIDRIISNKKLIAAMAQEVEWLRLLHYQKDLFSGDEAHFTSQQDDLQFFISAFGKNSPEQELRDTLWALQEKSKRRIIVPHTNQAMELTARCQFPARAAWIQSHLKTKYHIDYPLEDISTCADFERFRDRVDARSVTLIFSSYYMNNPSSTFGHTLLRLNRVPHGERGGQSSELLDIGVNFAANPTTDNQLLYAFYGMTGGFPGTFAVIPYYYKVREYNDYESRDLWEYDLKLTDEEVQRLVAHLWEISFSTFDYYYISENCSYHMLSLLEAAAPRLGLTSKLPFWVIPSETIRAINDQPNFVVGIHFRPSIYTQFKSRLLNLNDKELDAFNQWKEGQKNWRYSLSPEQRAHVLDAGLDYYDYKYAQELLLQKSGPRIEEKKELLIERSELPRVKPLVVKAPVYESPHLAHPSGRGGLLLSDLQNWELQWRFALHDFRDPLVGYPQYAEINFFALSWKYQKNQSESLLLKDFKLVGITSLSPLNENEPALSWRVQVGWEQEPELTALGTPFFLRLGAGGAGTWDLLVADRLSLYGLLQTKISHKFELSPTPASFLSIGPVVGVRWAWDPQASFNFEWTHEEVFSPRRTQRHSIEMSQTYQPSADDPWLLEAKVSDDVTVADPRFYLGLQRYF